MESTEATKGQFGSELIALSDIFDGHHFSVPDYQRNYSWEKPEVDDLLKDIDHLLVQRTKVRHYTGTLVLGRPEGAKGSEFHVVDGQQRLTTLVILMRALRDKLPEELARRITEVYLWRGGLGNERPVLALNGDTKMFFNRVVIGDVSVIDEPASLEAHSRLLQARKLIEAWVTARERSGPALKDVLDAVETRLGFLVFAPKEDAETGVMFEVINNRGKLLSELEKVKNYLIYCCVKLSAKSLRESIDRDWSMILRDLNCARKTSNSDEGSFLRYCGAVHLRLSKEESNYGYTAIKKHVNIDNAIASEDRSKEAIARISEFVSFLRSAALWYARLYGQLHTGLKSVAIQQLRQLAAQQQHASIMPLFLAIVIKLGIESDDAARLLRLLEILNFRVYIARKITARNDSGQANLYSLAAKFYHNELLADFSSEARVVGSRRIETEIQALEYSLVRFVLWYATDSLFIDSFRLEEGSPDDFYRWAGLRYFLMSYEAHLQPSKTIPIEKILLSRSDGKTGDYMSVEHLWAIENRSDQNDRDKDWREKRRLGNLILLELRLNIQGQNDDLEKKIERYREGFENEGASELEQVRKMVLAARAILKQKNEEGEKRTKEYYWSLHHGLNNKREEQMISFAKLRWSLKEFLGYRQLSKDPEVVGEPE